MIFIPAAIFLAAVSLAWLARTGADRWPSDLTVIAGSVGVVSAIATAYVVHDRSQKFADLDASTHTAELAAVLLVAHALLFLALLLRRARP